MTFEENWPRNFRGDVIQMCGKMGDDRQQVITIAHPEPSAQVS